MAECPIGAIVGESSRVKQHGSGYRASPAAWNENWRDPEKQYVRHRSRVTAQAERCSRALRSHDQDWKHHWGGSLVQVSFDRWKSSDSEGET